MRYISTRGAAPALPFDDVLLTGLARDGGLYVPESWPRFSPGELRDFSGMPYHEIAYRVMAPFVEGAIDLAVFKRIVTETYQDFGHAAVAPLVQISPNEWVMELFHGPTLAFKDYAMQLLGIVPRHDGEGCLQDIHWYDGAWGYFPTYTLGAMTAAQLFASAEQAHPNLREEIAKGEFATLVGWLRQNIHGKGSSRSSRQLLIEATGRPLDAAVFKAHLIHRYLS